MSQTTKVFLICSGLGHVRRGFESFFEQCFAELADEPSLRVTLFRGAGVSSRRNDRVLSVPLRESVTARRIGRVLRCNPNESEQTLFAARLVPYLLREKPDVVYFSQDRIGELLAAIRRRTGLRYRLLFRNGSPHHPPFPLWDVVQQLSPVHYDAAIEWGESPQKHRILPNAIAVDQAIPVRDSDQKMAIRRRLGLPTEKPILLSVAAINASQKRIDYVIREAASLPEEQRPFLLLLGQRDVETPSIEALAQSLLRSDDYAIETALPEAVPDYYQAADVFTLASHREGFGRAYAEALSYGLPCLADDNALTRYVFGGHGFLGDLSQSGVLAEMIRGALHRVEDADMVRKRHQYVHETFSWAALRESYIRMFYEAAEA
ncbi:MAG: glycosyltransferase family 4 protein [Armatimonadota bacterium]